MKPATGSTLSILGAGQCELIHLYQITLAGGAASYYFTSHQVPVLFNGRIYDNNLSISRGNIKQSIGMSVDSFDLQIAPQTDGGKIATIAGLPFLTAVAQRLLDGARVIYSKIFSNSGFTDFSAGAVVFFQGRINQVDVGRHSAKLTVHSDVEMLNTNMPPHVIMPPCSHTLFDRGCGLLATNPAFNITSAATAGSTVLQVFHTTNVKVAEFFTQGKLLFTSGANAQSPPVTYYVKQYTVSGGVGCFNLVRPLPNAPAVGNTFAATAGCKKTMAACANKDTSVGPPFNNLQNFDGEPFVPVPETIYNGGVRQVINANTTGQTGVAPGSPLASRTGLRNVFKP